MSDLTERVRSQLAEWGLTGTIEGAAALDLAERLTGDEDLRPAAAAMLHAQLRALAADLRKLAPPAKAADDVSAMQDAFDGLRAVPDP